ncbi:MAG: hypothetical protein EBZ95_12725 [Chitinophagia bacterium]|nr:hypothetical protein [Chitinophagia bacterium]
MKSAFILSLFLIVIFSSCVPCKLITISSDNIPLKLKGYEFENDSIRINYRFWGAKGKMEFDIYNKTDITLYFDWKISAYIPNDKMVSYYDDLTNLEGVYYTYRQAWSSRMNTAKNLAKQQERIAVVPPHSLITNSQYKLVKKYIEVGPNGNFNNINSPLRFRNYLTLSTNEKFEGKISTIDNDFFISNIKKVSFNRANFYKSPTTFYASFDY